MVESWKEVIDVSLPYVTFEGSVHFYADDVTPTSTSTLRFRARDELDRPLVDSGFYVLDVREAPDRPRQEFVYVAARI